MGRVFLQGDRCACADRLRNGSRARRLHAVRKGSLAAPGWDVSLADDVAAAPARLPPPLLPAHFLAVLTVVPGWHCWVTRRVASSRGIGSTVEEA
jgi:hypothetical protein